MYVKHLVVAVALFCFCALCAGAFEFQPLGFESIGMGGAGVASAGGPMAGYYNPALLAVAKHPFEFNLGGGATLRDNNLAENIDKLSKYDLVDLFTRIADNHNNPGNNTQSDKDAMKDVSSIMNSMKGGNNSLSVMPAAAFGVQMKRFGLGLYLTSEATGQAIIDPNHMDFIVKTSGNEYWSYNVNTGQYGSTALTSNDFNASSIQYAIQNNLTFVKGSGLALVEVPVSFAQQFKTHMGALSVGASAKLMAGTVYDSIINIDTASSDLQKQFDKTKTDSTTIGVDLGLLFQPAKMPNLRLGVMAKDINSPKFKTVDQDYAIDPMYRAGLSYGLFNNKVDMAVDYDLSVNSTAAGFDSQYLGGGLNFHPSSWLSIRAGLMQNVADSSDGIIYTGGFGLGLKQLQLDLSVQASGEKGTYDGKSIPRYLKGNLALVSRW